MKFEISQEKKMGIESLIVGKDRTISLLKRLFNSAPKNSSNIRTEEALTLQGDVLYYSYLINRQEEKDLRVLCTIRVRSINKVLYNAETEELCLCGDFEQRNYSNKPTTIGAGKRQLDSLVIHDYFVPSLKDELRRLGVMIIDQTP